MSSLLTSLCLDAGGPVLAGFAIAIVALAIIVPILVIAAIVILVVVLTRKKKAAPPNQNLRQ
jgi:hypothetical protein